MKLFKSKLIGAALTVGILGFAHGERAFCQDAPPEKSQALLEKVKQDQLDSRIAVKQTEIDRLKLDMDKGKKDMDSLERNIDATTALVADSSGTMAQLAAEEKHLEQSLDLTELRIEAERKNSEALKSLGAAQSKELDAINQRMVEMDTRSRVREAEVALLSQGKPVPGEDNDEKGAADLEKLKKTLASNEQKTIVAETLAINAMKAASARMTTADEAAAQAKRMADSMANGTPAPVGEQTNNATPPSKPKAAPASKPKASASPTPKTKNTTPKQ